MSHLSSFISPPSNFYTLLYTPTFYFVFLFPISNHSYSFPRPPSSCPQSPSCTHLSKPLRANNVTSILCTQHHRPSPSRHPLLGRRPLHATAWAPAHRSLSASTTLAPKQPGTDKQWPTVLISDNPLVLVTSPSTVTHEILVHVPSCQFALVRQPSFKLWPRMTPT